MARVGGLGLGGVMAHEKVTGQTRPLTLPLCKCTKSKRRCILNVIPVKSLTRPRIPVVQAVVILAILALAGCSSSTTSDADGGGGGGGGKKGKGKGGGGGNAGRVPVLVSPATKRDVPIQVAAVGSVEAYTPISVKSLVTGEITNVFFK